MSDINPEIYIEFQFLDDSTVTKESNLSWIGFQQIPPLKHTQESWSTSLSFSEMYSNLQNKKTKTQNCELRFYFKRILIFHFLWWLPVQNEGLQYPNISPSNWSA